MKVSIDFESRSTADIWETGAWMYSRHPSTRVLCLAVAVDNGPVDIVTFQELEAVRGNPSAPLSSLLLTRLNALTQHPDATFHAFSAFFERSIWTNIMVPQLGMKPVPDEKWRCTQAKALAFGLPATLSGAAGALGLPEAKDLAGGQIMKKLSRPALRKKGDAPDLVRWHADIGEFERLYEYCKQDVVVERALDRWLPDLNPTEQKIWLLDQKINFRGVNTDVEFVGRVRALLNEHNARLNAELCELTGGVVSRGSEVAGMLAYLKGQGLDLPDLQKKTVSDAIASGRVDEHCLQVLRYRVELGKSSNAKYEKLATATDTDGVLRECYQYHRGSTGRWGGQLVQLQNLPVNRTKVDEEEAIENIKTLDPVTLSFIYGGGINNVASACVRGVFIPRSGNEFLVGDYAAIEARAVMWLAGEQRGLEEFRQADMGNGPEIYVRMAQKIFGNPKLTKENKNERNVGKTTILGAGFGMGVNKFYQTCLNWGVVGVTEDVANTCINAYRNTYPAVRDFWYATERAAVQAVNFPGKGIQCGKTTWIYNRERDFLFCRLPSGRFLAYQRPRIVAGNFGPQIEIMGVNSLTKKWAPEHVYGGKLVENITQAVARDIMAEAMLRAEAAGFPVTMHTHDEIVSEVKMGSGSLEKFLDLICQLPEWAKDFPIKAEGFSAERYTKK